MASAAVLVAGSAIAGQMVGRRMAKARQQEFTQVQGAVRPGMKYHYWTKPHPPTLNRVIPARYHTYGRVPMHFWVTPKDPFVFSKAEHGHVSSWQAARAIHQDTSHIRPVMQGPEKRYFRNNHWAQRPHPT